VRLGQRVRSGPPPPTGTGLSWPGRRWPGRGSVSHQNVTGSPAVVPNQNRYPATPGFPLGSTTRSIGEVALAHEVLFFVGGVNRLQRHRREDLGSGSGASSRRAWSPVQP